MCMEIGARHMYGRIRIYVVLLIYRHRRSLTFRRKHELKMFSFPQTNSGYDHKQNATTTTTKHIKSNLLYSVRFVGDTMCVIESLQKCIYSVYSITHRVRFG